MNAIEMLDRIGIDAQVLAQEAGCSGVFVSRVRSGRARASQKLRTAADRLLRRTLEERLALLTLELARSERA